MLKNLSDLKNFLTIKIKIYIFVMKNENSEFVNIQSKIKKRS